MLTVRRATFAAAVVALAVFVAVLTYGRGVWFRAETFGGFYDAQADSFLQGRMDVDPGALSLEAFVIGGRSYEYFGPVPALMRVPWRAITHSGTGRSTALSMLGAQIVLLAMLRLLVLRAVRLGIDSTTLKRIGARRVAVIAAAFVLTVACGPPLFAASRPWVYHEASLWAMAFFLWGLDRLWACHLEPTRRRWALLGLAATACVLTRGSLGFGLVAAAAVVAGLELLSATDRGVARRIRAWWGRDGRRASHPIAACLAVLIPIALYAGVNEAKFGSAFGLPIDAQVVSKFDPARIRALEANDGSLFSAGYAPTVALATLRPDGIAPRALFPFVGFPRGEATVIGSPVFDKLDVTTSLPATLPGLVLIAAVGVGAALRSQRWRRRLVALLPAWLGAGVASVGVLTIGFVANRYLMDLLPLVLIPALGGLSVAVARLGDDRADQATTRRGNRLALAAVALTTAWTMWVGTALALEYQRELAFGVPDADRASWVRTQADVGALRGDVSQHMAADRPLPPPVRNEILVVGDCEAVYRADTTMWRTVWADANGGHVDVRIPRDALDAIPDGGTLDVAAARSGDVVALRREGGLIRAELRAPDGTVTSGSAGGASLDRVARSTLAVTIDGRLGFAGTWVGDVEVLSIAAPLGGGPVRALAGDLMPTDRSTCEALGY